MSTQVYRRNRQQPQHGLLATSRRRYATKEGDVGPATNTSSYDANAMPSSTSGVDASKHDRKTEGHDSQSKATTGKKELDADVGPATNTWSQNPNAMPSTVSGIDAAKKQRGLHTSAKGRTAVAASFHGANPSATDTSADDLAAKSSHTPRENTTSERSLQPSADSTTPQNHYDFFPRTLPRGSPPNGPFAIDLRALRQEFLSLQANAHPDRHPGDIKHRAEALSSRINDAYKTLVDPLSRAQYVLSLNGIDVAGDETAKVEDQGLLMEVLEAREIVEDAESPEDLTELRTKNHRRIDETVALLKTLLEKADWEGAKREAVRLRYWNNIRESLQNWEQGKPVVLEH